jgi:enoyl-[acyl-carrier protein] reductase I
LTGLMKGKRGLIMGLANERSLAWGIARALGGQGAELAFSYQGEALEKRVRPLAAELGSDLLVDCDVSDMKALDTAFDAIKERWGKLDFVVHAIGFSDKNELRGKFVDTSMDNFLMTMNISVYSFVAVAQRARALIRVNAISAGPIQTLAARGIGDFNYIMKWNEYNSPLRRNVTIDDVGGAGLYLLSDLASGVTGEIHHVDAGYNVVGMKAEDAPDISTV